MSDVPIALLKKGTIEEKVFQRQISKQGLSGAVVDSKANVAPKFSREDLKVHMYVLFPTLPPQGVVFDKDILTVVASKVGLVRK